MLDLGKWHAIWFARLQALLKRLGNVVALLRRMMLDGWAWKLRSELSASLVTSGMAVIRSWRRSLKTAPSLTVGMCLNV